MSIERRLRGLEKAASEALLAGLEPPWASSEAYGQLRREVQAEIELAVEAGGGEPLCWIDGEGIIRATDNDSFVRHMGEYIQALHRRIARLGREIAEERANMSPEEIQQADAEDTETLAALSKLSIDEGIALLKAQIAEIEAEDAKAETALLETEGGGGSR